MRLLMVLSHEPPWPCVVCGGLNVASYRCIMDETAWSIDTDWDKIWLCIGDCGEAYMAQELLKSPASLPPGQQVTANEVVKAVNKAFGRLAARVNADGTVTINSPSHGVNSVIVRTK